MTTTDTLVIRIAKLLGLPIPSEFPNTGDFVGFKNPFDDVAYIKSTSSSPSWLQTNVINPTLSGMQTSINSWINFQTNILTPIQNNINSWIGFQSNILTPIQNNINSWINFQSNILSPIQNNINSWIGWTNNVINPVWAKITDNLTAHLATILPGKTIVNNFITNIINKLFDQFKTNGVSLSMYYDVDDFPKFRYNNDLLLPTFSWGKIVYHLLRKIRKAIHDVITSTADFYNAYAVGTEINFCIPLFSGYGIKIAEKINGVWIVDEQLLWPDTNDIEEMKLYLPLVDWPMFNLEIPDFNLTNKLYKNVNGSWVNNSMTYYKSSDLIIDFIFYASITALLAAFSYAGMHKHAENFAAKAVNNPISPGLTVAKVYNNFEYKSSVFANMASLMALINSLVGTTNNILYIRNLLANQNVELPEVNFEKPQIPDYSTDISEINTELSDINIELSEHSSSLFDIWSKVKDAKLKFY